MDGGVIPGSVVGEWRMGMIDPSYKLSHLMGSWAHSWNWEPYSVLFNSCSNIPPSTRGFDAEL